MTNPAPRAPLGSPSAPRGERPLRVLVATDDYLPHLGGVQAVATLLARGLAARGDDVAVLAPRTSDVSAFETIDDLPVHRIRLGRPGLEPREIVGFARQWPRAEIVVRRVLRELEPDVIHVVFVNSGVAIPLLGPGRPRRPAFVATAQGQDVLGMPRRRYLGRWLSRACLRRADAVTACSEDLLCDARRIANDPSFRGVALPNMIDLAEFEAPPAPSPHPRPYLVTIAALVRKKGLDVLLRAYAGLVGSRDVPDLIILGEGPERARLESLRSELGLGDRVLLPGPVARASVVRHLRHARLFVLPSRVEPFGIVLAEAMGAGRAIVATTAGGIPEVVEAGRQGLLVPPEDEAGLARAIATLLDDPDRAARMGEAGRERARDVFSHRTVVARYRALYLELLRGRAGSRPRRRRAACTPS